MRQMEHRNDVTTEVSQTVSQDLELQQRIRAGDSAAFAELYATYKQRVYAYCSMLLSCSGSVDDVFQDVFIGMLERIRQGLEIECVGAYLMRSARNRCLNVLRNRKPSIAIDADEFDLPADSSTESADVQNDVRQAIQQLPEKNREVLILYEYHGYSYDEIARFTDVPVSTVRKRLFRARNSLRRTLNP
jgi:RNA polymerase sigma-70 factor, ECF subfamily